VKKISILLTATMCLISGEFCLSEETEPEITNFWRCASPTDGFWRLNDKLAPSGIEIGLGLTSVYQANAKGGASTNDRRGRYVGRYDLELSADLEKLLGIKGGSLFIHGWGGWPDTEGIDGHSVGSAWGINALSVGNRSMDIVEFFYEGPFFSDNLTLAIGKLDFTGIFDASEYADDECYQFLNASLVDDPAIPFPEPGLGLMLKWDLTDSWYLMTGVADAQADSRETGFRTTFYKEDYFFYALETGKTLKLDSTNGLMPGTYRAGMWVDGQEKERFSNSKIHRNDTGFYISCDQMLYKENTDIEDNQGLGGFFRYGWADSKVNEITNFWSAGLQYQGLFEGRNEDVLGVGFAHGTFSDNATDYIEDYESALEVYYNAQLAPWLSLSPSIQYIANPGGAENIRDAVVLGLRVRMEF
jgi:porin